MRHCILRDRSFEPHIPVGTVLRCDDFFGELPGWLTVAVANDPSIIFHAKPEQVLMLQELYKRQPTKEFWAIAAHGNYGVFEWVSTSSGNRGEAPFRFESEGEMQHFLNLGSVGPGRVFWAGKFTERKS